MRRGAGWAATLVVALAGVFAGAQQPAVVGADPVVIGSKNFTESYILGEAVAQLLEGAGYPVERKLGLGGTKICYDALAAGDLDVYVEYTGTIALAIKDLPADADRARLQAALAEDGVTMHAALGFNNTYALAVSAAVAEARGIAKVSDLAAHGDLRLAVSHEFLEREDGWPGLQAAYGFDWIPEGIEHSLAYQAIADGAIDGTDAYSTDGELDRYAIAVLADDRGFFPAYLAVPLARADLPPGIHAAIARTANTIDDAEMRAMNAAALGGESTAAVARAYLLRKGLVAANIDDAPAGAPDAGIRPGLAGRVAANTLRHLALVGMALLPATAVALLAALAMFRSAVLSAAAVYAAGLLQTIPSIALLALLIPLTGIGVLPAVVALFLYALLPILRNAVTSLAAIDPTLRQVAVAMGLTPAQQLRHVFVPLAMPSIVAGVRTAAVIGVGTATLAAFIGAGGLGDPIVKGLALNDAGLIMEGALPAIALAIAAELAFERLERALVPGHLRAGG